MQIKLLKEIIEEIAGTPAVDVLDLIFGKKDVNEFLIAKKIGLTINQIRNIFYKLANFGLVSFIRKKDKRKGWYTYFWTLNIERTLEFLDKRLEKEIESLNHQLESRKTKRFYQCKDCEIEVSEETALSYDFTCQECGEVYQLRDNTEIIKELEKKIVRAERQRKEVLEELGIIGEKKKKSMGRKRRKEEKEKLKIKEAKRKALKRKREKLKKEKEKLEGKSKKKVKKNPKKTKKKVIKKKKAIKKKKK